MPTMRIVRFSLGSLYLIAPKAVPDLLGVPTDRRARVVVRILGARHVLQAGAVSTTPDHRDALAVGSVVDAIHALSMVALAAVDRRRRRLAVADAGAATAFALAGWRRAHRFTHPDARSA
jgi:hypothetical protein